MKTNDLREAFKVKNRLPKGIWNKLKVQGYYSPDDLSIEKKYKGYFLVIEFCIGDFCTYPCSKNGHWLLEDKFRARSLIEALVHIVYLEKRIDAGEHWVGEND